MGEGATSNSPADGAPSPTPLERRQAQLARRLQQLRKEAGMGQKQLATLLGVSQGRVSQIETARYSLTPETITRLADALGLTAAVRDELTADLADLQTDVLSLRLATRRGHRANQLAEAVPLHGYLPSLGAGARHRRSAAEPPGGAPPDPPEGA
ncbi:MAG TPA: helix-turn-helix domain-containing protein [Candidatus Dormibacteraeota bacterium]